jgi:hypothetical protein
VRGYREAMALLGGGDAPSGLRRRRTEGVPR